MVSPLMDYPIVQSQTQPARRYGPEVVEIPMNHFLTVVISVALLISFSRSATPFEKADGNGRNTLPQKDTPIFDGKSLDCLDGECVDSWKVEKGAIVNKKSEYGGGQSRKDYSDGILRFRFENTAADEIGFEFRQGDTGKFKISFGKSECAAMAGKAHELVVVCSGAKVTAKLDGKAATVSASGQPQEGRFKFTVDHGTLRVLEIGFQRVPTK